MLNKIINIISIYEDNNEKAFVQYLKKEKLDWSDFNLMLNYIDFELKNIINIEQEIMYEKQIRETFKINKKFYDFYLDKESLNEVLNELDESVMKNYSSITFNRFKEIHIISYKFQLKYFSKTIDEILGKSFWETLTLLNKEI